MPTSGSYNMDKEGRTGGLAGSVTNTEISSVNGNAVNFHVNGGSMVTPECNGNSEPSTILAVDGSTCTEKSKVPESPSISSIDKKKPREKLTFLQRWRRRHVKEKLVHVVSVVTVVVMAFSVLKWHWFLPYYYAITLPILIMCRLYVYCKYKWQYFMLDFCYFGNLLMYIYIWAAPGSAEYLLVMFALTNGPLMWATAIYRNSIVFYSTDKMTSVYIHVIPCLLTYVLRWFPKTASEHWYTEFAKEPVQDLGMIFVYAVAVSLGAYIFHTFLYIFLIYAVFRPSEDYLYSYNYLLSSESGWIHFLVTHLGKKSQFVVYYLINWLICLASSLLGILWYKYLWAHTIFLTLILVNLTWNGATYYIDVLAVKGLRKDDADNTMNTI